MPKAKKATIHRQLKQLDADKKSYYAEQTNEIMEETYERNEFSHRLKEYNKTKRMQWWHYLIGFGIAILLTGLSFLIGFLAKDSRKTPDYQATGWASLCFTVLIFVTILIFIFIKNRKAARYFEDKRRRYQKTLSKDEAICLLAIKILLLAFLLMLIVAITTGIVFAPK